MMGLPRYENGAGAVIAALLLVLAAANSASAQSPTPSCASKLVPCAGYINSTKPPASCCDPLKEAVRDDLKCLCDLYSDPGIFKSFGVNITEALELPKHCGITKSIDQCSKKSSPPSSGPAGNSTSTSAPPTPPGDKSSACRGVAWIGFFCLTSLHVLWAVMSL